MAENEQLRKTAKQLTGQNNVIVRKRGELESSNTALLSERDQLVGEINELKDQNRLLRGSVRGSSNAMSPFSPTRGTSSESDTPTEDERPVPVNNSHDQQVDIDSLSIIRFAHLVHKLV